MKRIGIYGGTFSPPHMGHIHAAKVFLDAMCLDRLLIIPTFQPPHKTRNELTSADDRMNMCRMAFSFSKRIEVSDIEIKREGKSYTSDTLRALTEEGARLFLLCGTDMFLTLDMWHEPDVILKLADIVCVRRENDVQTNERLLKKAEEYREKFGATVHMLTAAALEISSSEIRARKARGELWKEMLTDDVASYIEQRGLYK